MDGNQPQPEPPREGALILAVDTCGPSGSVALGRIEQGAARLIGQIELEGRSYSATLIAAIGKLLENAKTELRALAAIVVVNGPGSFTGVRVGLSAAKGLAESAGLPLVALSRLEVLAVKVGVVSAALDAHRHEVFLRVAEGTDARELLAGSEELAAIPAPKQIAVCDAAAAALLTTAWPDTEKASTAPPTAADALALGLVRMREGAWADVALVDGHYLRRSDAEIFGDPANAGARGGTRP